MIEQKNRNWQAEGLLLTRRSGALRRAEGNEF